MPDVLVVWTQGLYVKFHEDIFTEWKACWEVLNRLDRTAGVTLSAFPPILVFGNSFWSEVFPKLCLVFVLGRTVQGSAGGCSRAFHVWQVRCVPEGTGVALQAHLPALLGLIKPTLSWPWGFTEQAVRLCACHLDLGLLLPAQWGCVQHSKNCFSWF